MKANAKEEERGYTEDYNNKTRKKTLSNVNAESFEQQCLEIFKM